MTSTSSMRSPMGPPPPLTRVPTGGSNYSGSTLHRTQTSTSSLGGYKTSPEGEYPPMPQPIRSPTGSSMGYGGPSRPSPAPLSRVPTNTSSFGGSDYSMPQAMRSPAPNSTGPYGVPPRSTPSGPYDRSASPAPSRPMPPRSDYDDNASILETYAYDDPAPSQMSSRPMGPSYGPGPGQRQGAYSGRPAPGGYPMRSQTGPMPPRGPPGQPQRNMTAPMPHARYGSPAPQQDYQSSQPQMYQDSAPQEYFNRPGTAHSQRTMPTQQRQLANQSSHARLGSGFSDLESQRGTPGPRY